MAMKGAQLKMRKPGDVPFTAALASGPSLALRASVRFFACASGQCLAGRFPTRFITTRPGLGTVSPARPLIVVDDRGARLAAAVVGLAQRSARPGVEEPP